MTGSIRDILNDIIEGIEVLDEDDIVDNGSGDDEAARMMLETIINDLTEKGVTRGRLSRFKGGGYRIPVSYEGRIFYITAKVA